MPLPRTATRGKGRCRTTGNMCFWQSMRCWIKTTRNMKSRCIDYCGGDSGLRESEPVFHLRKRARRGNGAARNHGAAIRGTFGGGDKESHNRRDGQRRAASGKRACDKQNLSLPRSGDRVSATAEKPGGLLRKNTVINGTDVPENKKGM